MEYEALVAIYEDIAATAADTEKTALLVEALETTDPELLGPVVLLLQGKLFPSHSDAELGISSSQASDAIAKATGVSEHAIETQWAETGDLGDAAAIAHLNHPGRMANPGIDGNVHRSATATPCERTGVTPARMDETDIEAAIKLYADAAARAERAGFDAIELQFGHGYLIAQFLSPAVNDRDDAYGGSLEARARFGFEVLEAVQAATDLPILARLTADDGVEGGIDLEQARWVATELEASENVERRNAAADPADVEEFDAAIVATGSEPIEPPIEGLDAEGPDGVELLAPDRTPTGERVLVVGGGYVGLEAADTLAQADNEVIVVELLEQLGGNMIDLEKGPLIERLRTDERVELNRTTALERVEGDTAFAQSDGETVTWAGIDRYMIATGVESNDQFLRAAEDADLDVPLYPVGDVEDVGKAEDTIAAGFNVARSL